MVSEWHQIEQKLGRNREAVFLEQDELSQKPSRCIVCDRYSSEHHGKGTRGGKRVDMELVRPD